MIENKLKLHFNWIALIVIVLAISSCENPFTKNIKEGVIHYTISYPSISEDNVMLDLMPKKMETAFKDDSYRTDIIAGMGLFKTSIINEKGKNNLTHTVKMLNKKYASILSPTDITGMNPDLLDITIEETGASKKIAGYNCKEAVIKKDNKEISKLYYTEEIDIETPNKATPFNEIPGVLMEYEMINYDTHMHFIVENVVEKEIDNDDLILEDGYEMVSSTRLESEIQAIFNKVK